MAKVELVTETRITNIQTGDFLLDDQFQADFSFVNDALIQQVLRFGYSYLDTTPEDGRQIDQYLDAAFKNFRSHNGYLPRKVREQVLDRNYCIQILGGSPHWVFFRPYLDKKDKKHITMDQQKILTLSTPQGRYYVARLKPGRTFVFKSHCVLRLQQRTDPPMTETEAMTTLMSLAYDTMKLSPGFQDFPLPNGGVVKSRVGSVQFEKDEKQNEHHIVICYTYFPDNFM